MTAVSDVTITHGHYSITIFPFLSCNFAKSIMYSGPSSYAQAEIASMPTSNATVILIAMMEVTNLVAPAVRMSSVAPATDAASGTEF